MPQRTQYRNLAQWSPLKSNGLWKIVTNRNPGSFVTLSLWALAEDTVSSDAGSTGLLICVSCLGVRGVKDRRHLIMCVLVRGEMKKSSFLF